MGTGRSRTAGGHAGHRPRFDREAAFAFFASDAQMTFRRVAAEFGVSEATIQKWAKRERWNERAETMRRQAAEKVVQRTLEQANREALRVAAAADTKMLAELVSDDFKLTAEGYVGIKKLEQLIFERPTEITLHEVSQAFVSFVRELEGLFVLALTEAGVNGKRSAVMAIVRREIGPLLERSTLAIGSGSE